MKRWATPVGALGLVAAAVLVARPSHSEPIACARPSDQVIPEWARTGFSDAEPRVPHVLGKDKRIMAILFGAELFAPPAEDRSNKILWVSRERLEGFSDLRIHARRTTDGMIAERTVPGGPGPSIVDLPEGCWRLKLSWSGHTDELELRYRHPD
jgi:hypothetical protein